jgi:hypothetical protein
MKGRYLDNVRKPPSNPIAGNAAAPGIGISYISSEFAARGLNWHLIVVSKLLNATASVFLFKISAARSPSLVRISRSNPSLRYIAPQAAPVPIELSSS